MTLTLEQRIAAYQANNRDPAERSVIANLCVPWVRDIASRYRRGRDSRTDFGDIIADGVVGLMKAIDAFDPCRNVKFKTFADIRVRGAILDGMRSQDWRPRRRQNNPALPLMLHVELSNRKTPAASRASLSWDEIGGRDPRTIDVDAEDNVEHLLRPLQGRVLFLVKLYVLAGLNAPEVGRVVGVSDSRVRQQVGAALGLLRAVHGGSKQSVRPPSARTRRKRQRIAAMKEAA